MKFSRNISLIFLIFMALLSSAYDSQHALSNLMMGIESSFKQVETRTSAASQFSFNDADIQGVLKTMKKAASELETASALGASDVVTDVSSRYLTLLAALHVLYAKQAHLSGASAAGFDFARLDPYNLRLHSDAAHPLVVQKPFNARHAGADLIEFFITAEENEMGEFLALNSPKDEFAYEKLIQFSSVRETYVNLWALQRLSYSELPVQSVKSCAPDLLSFRLSGPDSSGLINPKSAEAYQQLIAWERYNTLTDKLAGAFNETKTFSLATSATYYSVLTRLFSTTAEFKTYIQGIPPDQVSAWLNGAAKAVAENESNDWLSDPENSTKIMGTSTLIGDGISSQQTAERMAEAVAERHLESAAAQIEKIATLNLKIEDSPQLLHQIQGALNSYTSSSAKTLAPKLIPSLKDLDNRVDSRKQVSDRIELKIAEIKPIAENLLGAVHDDLLLNHPIERLENSSQEYLNGLNSGSGASNSSTGTSTTTPKVYVSGDYQYFIADSGSFRSYLLGELLLDNSLNAAFGPNSSAMNHLSHYFEELDRSAALKMQQLGPQASRVQQGQAVLELAQSDAQAELGLANSDSGVQALLNKAFNTVQLFSAKKPQDLAPTKDAQKRLVASAIAQGYELDPFLGVAWKRPGVLAQNQTLLYYIYSDGIENLNGLTLEALQNAVNADNGKLEDFCQADLKNTATDPRFRNMFLSAGHLRQIIDRPNNPAQAAALKNIDDDLVKKTQTTQELILNRYLNPALGILFVATLVVIAIGLTPLSSVAALPIIMAILNYGLMAPLSAVQLYMDLSVNFYEKPAQLKYQDAIASSLISTTDPFNDWEQMKKLGLVPETTDRTTVDANRSALRKTQALTIASLPMDIWYGKSIMSGVRSNVGITGMIKLKQLFGGTIPPFANTVKAATAPSFAEIASRDGVTQAVKTTAVQAIKEAAVIGGVTPIYGLFNSREAAMALKNGLARAMPDDASTLLPEIKLYGNYLAARIKFTSEASLTDLGKESDSTAQISADNTAGATEAVLQGHLGIKEAMENPDLKFLYAPKSAFQAAREHRFGQWWNDHGAETLKINLLRGKFIQSKIAQLSTLEQKIEQSSQLGESPEQLLARLSDQELLVMEEAARGPQWLAFGYWDAKLARFQLTSSPLKKLLDVFNDYRTMLRSIRPYDWAPQAAPAGVATIGAATETPANTATGTEQEDLRNYYGAVQAQDGMEIARPAAVSATTGASTSAQNPSQLYDTQETQQLEHEIEPPLFSSLN